MLPLYTGPPKFAKDERNADVLMIFYNYHQSVIINNRTLKDKKKKNYEKNTTPLMYNNREQIHAVKYRKRLHMPKIW